LGFSLIIFGFLNLWVSEAFNLIEILDSVDSDESDDK